MNFNRMPESMTSEVTQPATLFIIGDDTRQATETGSVVAVLVGLRDFPYRELAAVRKNLDGLLGSTVPFLTYEPTGPADKGWEANGTAGFRQRDFDIDGDGTVKKTFGRKLDDVALRSLSLNPDELREAIDTEVLALTQGSGFGVNQG